MKAVKITLVVFLLSHSATAQVLEDFSDGDFLFHPTWQGDQSRFVVAGGKLKLQAPAATGTAYLSTASQAVHEASWEFNVQMDFTPSSTNYAKFYLISSNQNLHEPLNGYFVKIGGTSREVSLYVQNNTTETEIIDGLDDRLNTPLINARIRVLRSGNGIWTLSSDVTLSGHDELEGTITHRQHTVSFYSGPDCIYTSTRADKFWFDQIIITGSVVPDTEPPSVLQANAADKDHIILTFSEPLNPSSVQPLNFEVDGIGHPRTTSLYTANTIELWLDNDLQNGVTTRLTVSGIEDVVGNRMAVTVFNLMYLKPGIPKRKDVIFSEIFPDPTPQVALPAAEFVEIYNRGSDPFDLTGWTLSDGSSTATFPQTVLLPGKYLVVTSTGSKDLFPQNVTGLANFPSLNNGEDGVSLKDDVGMMIDTVRYRTSWYRDEDKAQGGWSLELIDTNNPCGEEDNWASSEDRRGGTPGESNSISAHKPDLTPPELTEIFPESAIRLKLEFNERLSDQPLSRSNIAISPDINVSDIQFSDASLKSLMVVLTDSLKVRQRYEVAIRDIEDCSGNPVLNQSIAFGLPEPADSLDVVINEILFNPRSGGVDFVELLNVSEKYIDLDQWVIGDSSDRAILLRRLLPPGQFAVVTSDPVVVGLSYPRSNKQSMMDLSLPNLPDDRGSVTIWNKANTIIDEVRYDHDWHAELLKSEEGVSLERIRVKSSSLDSDNWTSASSVVGFATPGYDNSQHRENTDLVFDDVLISPEIFVPGQETSDFVLIQFKFSQPGKVANVCIANRQGGIVKQIANNELLGAEGFFRWNGEMENGAKAPTGYYFVWFEAFQADGNLTTFRKRVVIAWR